MKPAEKLYFAYGSNMLLSRIQERVGKVTKVGTHRLRGYRLTLDVCTNPAHGSVANLIKTGDYQDFVEGVVYSLSPKQVKTLDMYEGAPQFYNRVIESYANKQLIVYICLSQQHIQREPMGMRQEYFHYLVEGARENGLSTTFDILQRKKNEPDFIRK